MSDLIIENDCEIDSLQTALFNNSMNKLYLNQNKINNNPFIFNHEVKPIYKITNQNHSGRCWIFAALNFVRILAAKQLNIKVKEKDFDLEFSQSYLFFWDKLEKYHRTLHYYLEIKKMDETKRVPYINHLYARALEDGGQWDMVKDLIKKYGIVPKQAMPDSHHAKDTHELNNFLCEMLKNDFILLDNAKPEEQQVLIKNMTHIIYKFLVGFLGKPPKEFEFIFNNKNKIETFNKLTPLKLLELIQFKPDEWVSVINDPRPENPYDNYYQVEFLGNVKNQHVGWLNVEMKRIEELTKISIDKNTPVWFGSDVSSERDKETGIMDVGLVDYRKAYKLLPNISKKDRLVTYMSLPNHAMVITGYHSNSNIERWKIENSWGETIGHKGVFLMTNNWFHQYVFQIVVHESLLNQKEKEALKSTPKIIRPWDPLGTLA
jgi:bleomycin hydrolase